MGLTWLSLWLKLGMILTVFGQKSKEKPSTHHIPLELKQLTGIPISGVRQNFQELQFLQKQLGANQGNMHNGPMVLNLPSSEGDKLSSFQPPQSFQHELGPQYPIIPNAVLNIYPNLNVEDINTNNFPIPDFSPFGAKRKTHRHDYNNGLSNQPNNNFPDFIGRKYPLLSPHFSQYGPAQNYPQDLMQGLNNDPDKLGNINSGGHLGNFFKYGEPNNGIKSQAYSSNAYYYENHKINHPSVLNKRDGYYGNKENNENGTSSQSYQNGEHHHQQQHYNSVSKKYEKKKSHYNHDNNKHNKPSYFSHQENGNKYKQLSPSPNHGHVNNNNGNHHSYSPNQHYESPSGNHSPNREYESSNNPHRNHHSPTQQPENGHSHHDYKSDPYRGNENSNQNPSHSPNHGGGNKNLHSQHSSYQGYDDKRNENQNSHKPYPNYENKKVPTDCSLCPAQGSSYGPNSGQDNNQDYQGYNSNHEHSNGNNPNQYHDKPLHEEGAERNHKGHGQWYSHGSNGNSNNRGQNKVGGKPGQNNAPHTGYLNKPALQTKRPHASFSGNNYRPQHIPYTTPGYRHSYNSQKPLTKTNGSAYLQRKSNPLKMSPSTEVIHTPRPKTKPVIHEIFMSDSLIKDDDLFFKGIQ